MNVLARANRERPSWNYGCHHRALVSIDEAISRIAEHVPPVSEKESLPLHRVLGRSLASPVVARSCMPRFDHAAMDGYALNASLLSGSGPWTLRVDGRVAAGDAAGALLEPGTAVRIFAGAPVPEGADSVVMQENVDRKGDSILLRRSPRTGENIRQAGEEHSLGDEILPVGTTLTPRAIAAAAATGQGVLEVVRDIRVALLVSGSEIVAPGTVEPGEGQIWDVNTPMLSALLTQAGVKVVRVNSIPDNLEATAAALTNAASEADLVITSGGISVGEEDHVSKAVAAVGGDVKFSGVSIKPGKPVSFGRVGGTSWLGLPGNPLSAFVGWKIFGEAVLRGLLGETTGPNARRRVTLAHDLKRKPGRCELRPAFILDSNRDGGGSIQCIEKVNSGQVSALVKADGLAVLPAQPDRLRAGETVEFLSFSDR